MAAPMSRAQRPGARILVVEPTVATRLPADEPQRIEADAAAVEWRAPGRAVLRDGAGRSIPVLLGTDRQAGPGVPRTIEVVVAGWRFELEVEDAMRADLRRRAMRDRGSAIDAGGPLEIHAIIPGRVAAVAVAPGDVVVAGQTLLVVEAMKMQNELRTPRDGTVHRVAVGVGETIDLGDLLLVLE
jgi:biotin carboxyl carrier protein